MIKKFSVEEKEIIKGWLENCYNHSYCDDMFISIFGIDRKKLKKIRTKFPHESVSQELKNVIDKALVSFLEGEAFDDVKFGEEYECCRLLAEQAITIKNILS